MSRNQRPQRSSLGQLTGSGVEPIIPADTITQGGDLGSAAVARNVPQTERLEPLTARDVFPDRNRIGPRRQLLLSQINQVREQENLLRDQIRQQQLLEPLLFEEAGIVPQFDESGAIIGFERAPETEEDQLRSEIERMQLERSRAALAGELPIDPALTDALAEEEELLRTRLEGQLGSGFETSTPGIEALSEFSERAERLRSAARRADLTLAEQLSLARGAERRGVSAQFLGDIAGIQGQGFGAAGTLGQLIQGANMPLVSLNQMEQIKKLEPDSGPGPLQSIGSLVGTIGTTALAGPFGGQLGAALFGRRPVASPAFNPFFLPSGSPREILMR